MEGSGRVVRGAQGGRPDALGTLGAHVDCASGRRLGALCRERAADPLAKADGADIDASGSTCPFWARPDPPGPLGARKAVKAASAADAGRPGEVLTPDPVSGGVSTRAPSGLNVSGWRICV